MLKELNSLLWWVPFKSVRDKIRNIYYDMNNRINNLEYNNNILMQDKVFKDRIIKYILYDTSYFDDYKIKRYFIELNAYQTLNYFPNLDKPRTLNEKINWIRLYYKNELIDKCVDKYLFKEYIKEKLGDGYTIPLLGVWDNVNGIDFDSLPKQFVLKSNAGSFSSEMIIVKDKSLLNIEETKFKINSWLQKFNTVFCKGDFVYGYKNIVPKIIAEKYIKEIEEEETDYSVFCSFGNILFFFIYYDKTYYINKACIFYDEYWNKLNIRREGYKDIDYIEKPKRFEEMKTIAKKLSEDFPLVRVDFYNLKDKLLVGELTFYPSGGRAKYEPEEWDYKFGEMIDLNKIPKEHLAQEWIDILNKDQTRPDQTRPDQTRPDQTRPNLHM